MIPENYEMKTTFFSDFAIANRFGKKAVIETYQTSFDSFKDDVVYMMELTFVLNINCWQKYHEGDLAMSKVYEELYYECYYKCLDNFKGKDIKKYLDFLDQSIDKI